MLDTLPGFKTESVLRFDHIQPIGKHHESYEALPHRLNDDALVLVDEWLAWLRSGGLDATTLLAEIQASLAIEGDGGSQPPP
jgi:hypothetical protein